MARDYSPGPRDDLQSTWEGIRGHIFLGIGIKCFDVEAASILRWDEGYCIPSVWEELHRAYAKGERNLTEAIDRI